MVVFEQVGGQVAGFVEDEVGEVVARTCGAFVGAVGKVVVHLGGEGEVADGGVLDAAVHDNTAAGCGALVHVASVVGREGCVEALAVGELVPCVVAVAPVGEAVGQGVVAHVLVDCPSVDGAHAVAEAAGVGVHEVGAQHNLHLFGGVEFAFHEHGEFFLEVLGNNTFVVHERRRSVCGVFFVTARNAEVVFLHEACSEEVAEVVVERVGILAAGTPATGCVGGVEAVGASQIGVLQRGSAQHVGEFPATVGNHGHFAVLATFCGDENNTVGAFLAVECRSGGALEHAHAFDVGGVEVGHRRTAAADGHAVDNEQRFVALAGVNRGDGADNDLRSRVGGAAGGRYLKTGNLALKGVDEVGALSGSDVVAAEFLHREVQSRFFLALTHGGYHHFGEHFGVFLHCHVDDAASADAYFQRFHANEGECEHVLAVGNVDGVMSVDVCNGTSGHALHCDGSARNGLAVGSLNHGTCNGTRLANQCK